MMFFWFRRDLRLEDNRGLIRALESGSPVQPVFIFDPVILDRLLPTDARVSFIYEHVLSLKKQLSEWGVDLWVFYGPPSTVFSTLLDEHPNASGLIANRDYEPYARKRDQEVHAIFAAKGKDFVGVKDHVVFDRNEVTKDDGTYYTVFTPYSKKWKVTLASSPEKPIRDAQASDAWITTKTNTPIPSLESMGFVPSFLDWPSKSVTLEILQGYEDRRNRPDWDATSRLGVHLRFGTIGIRTLLEQAQNRSDVFVNELIWRDFYHMILYHNLESPNKAIKSAYDFIEWEKNEDHFARWCQGTTGYPLVDAGMRELNATGFMHNRVRMVVASFLTKHLLLDWRLGERYFAQKLLDFDLAANVGGWQWASGSGCDAAPYFRIFNPAAQQEKFDPQFKYIRKWIPEWGTAAYPKPVVEHTWARQRALSRYKTGLASGL
jgi:deoxyribodipyrimidine photo-lyase